MRIALTALTLLGTSLLSTSAFAQSKLTCFMIGGCTKGAVIMSNMIGAARADSPGRALAKMYNSGQSPVTASTRTGSGGGTAFSFKKLDVPAFSRGPAISNRPIPPDPKPSFSSYKPTALPTYTPTTLPTYTYKSATLPTYTSKPAASPAYNYNTKVLPTFKPVTVPTSTYKPTPLPTYTYKPATQAAYKPQPTTRYR